MEEKIKDKFYSILEKNNFSFDKNLRNNDQVAMTYSSEDSKSFDTCECGSTNCTCKSQNHSIDFITNINKEIFFDMTNRMKNLEIRKKYLTTLRNSVLDKQADTITKKSQHRFKGC